MVVREARRKGLELPRYQVDQEVCTGCGVCIKAFGCPAFYVAQDGSIRIDGELCTGCGVCAQVCPYDAIKMVEGGGP